MSKYNALVKKLKEIFQIDRPELDFGIYRILNAKADEINNYLENTLKSKISDALATVGNANKVELVKQLEAATKAAQDAGFEADDSPKVKDLRKQITEASQGANEHENAVFTHLLSFFSRYYDRGDFISKRRYKGDTYAIPYAGEEVMLHWANKDQYYIKSGENFANYSFKLDDGRKVSFKLLAADTAKDNRKDNNADRRFVLIEPHARIRYTDEAMQYEEEYLPVSECTSDGLDELVILFEYKSVKKGTVQTESINNRKKGKFGLNELAVEKIKEIIPSGWEAILDRHPTETNENRTLIEKHLTTYTQRNTADYFIHKDLRRFLANELDFYIKNEVMNLDNVQNAEVFSDIEKQLRTIQCLRTISLDLVNFLSQMENFQKKLWEKRKFVINTNYVVTLDLIPDILIDDVIRNQKQLQEWIDLFGIDDTQSINKEFISKNCDLLVDTRHFNANFKEKLINSQVDIDSRLNGCLISSDNYQALNLIKNKYRNKIKFTYIDPPYNTGGDGFFYRDSFKHSSWLTMMLPKLRMNQDLLTEDGVIYASIDAVERTRLQHALDLTFGEDNKVEEVIWAQNTTKNQSPTFSTNHEYVHVYAKNIETVKKSEFMFRELKPGYKEVQEIINELNPDYPSIDVAEKALSNLYKSHKAELKENGIDPKEDPWKSLTNYNRAEYRDKNEQYVDENLARDQKAKIRVWREVDTSLPQVKEDSQKDEFKDPEDPDFRFYQPLHPLTGKPCKPPKTGWRWSLKLYGRQSNSFEILQNKNRIVFGKDESKVPQQKSFLHEVATNVAKSVVNDYADGEKELRNLFGKSRAFSNPKPTTLIERFCIQSDMKDSEYAMDYFAGSGTTGDAIISLNKKEERNRKFLLVEMGSYFDSVLLHRIKKSAYALYWEDGIPLRLSIKKQISSLQNKIENTSEVEFKKRTNKIKSLKARIDDDISYKNFMVKYTTLESYEDTLNNIILNQSHKTLDLFNDLGGDAKSDYLLNYMLETESKGSLLSTDDFKKPFDYKMKIAVDSAGASEEKSIDLVETFNYLIGLHINTIESSIERGYVRIEGKLPNGERALILWRDCEKIQYDDFNKFANRFDLFAKQKTFDVIYVNGDHNLPTAFTNDEGEVTRTLKLRQIEPEFLELMFAPDDLA